MVLKPTRQLHEQQDIFKGSKYFLTHNYKQKNSFTVMLVLRTNLFQAIYILGDNLNIMWFSHLLRYNYIHNKYKLFSRWMQKMAPNWMELCRNRCNLCTNTQTHTHPSQTSTSCLSSLHIMSHPSTTSGVTTFHPISGKCFIIILPTT